MRLINNRLTRAIFWLIGIYLIVVLARELWQAPQAIKRVDRAEEEVERLEEEQAGLRSRLEEVQSEDFIEKEIRDKLGMVKPGEVAVMIPEELRQRTEEEEVAVEDEKVLPIWRQWVEVFF